ncbi:hypothetical protein B0H34DRAFT_781939 [Crassisporium funariophilum]|nr:hypothetical protein B0H34DRAFT_781939 [Crassisporium funariophilum]
MDTNPDGETLEFVNDDDADPQWVDVSDVEDNTFAAAMQDVIDYRYLEDHDFTIQIVDIYTAHDQALIKHSSESDSVARALALQGYTGNTPKQPTLAFAITTLEMFRLIRARKALFSIEAFAKVICDIYCMPYRRRYCDALSNAFDAYLTVIRHIDAEVAKVLGFCGPDWRVKNACPACSYELDGKPPLTYRQMLAMDANFSLKRMAYSGRKNNPREFCESNYYLRDIEIERYAHQVKHQEQGPQLDKDDMEEGVERHEENEGGDPTDGGAAPNIPSSSGCAERWKAASADEKKKMWNVFDELGLFALACRHGLILWIADLVRSGELPLAVVGKALDVLGERLLIGYDIGCLFGKTILSSCIGEAFQRSKSRCCVNTFHGYLHSFDCQKQHHPNSIEGMGLEDLETLERVFSASNVLAGVTQYMSRYQRRVFIDLFFKQWDTEKYENIGNMIHNNYLQALWVIEKEEPALHKAKTELGITDENFQNWQQEEATYFRSLGKEPKDDVRRVAYVELLLKFREYSDKYSRSTSQFLLSTPGDAAQKTYELELSATRRHQIHIKLLKMEIALDIKHCWTPANKEYQDAAAYSAKQEYCTALDHLQKLVVQCLFELHKLNLSFTAVKLNPPRPTVDWLKVSHYRFLEDFELLKGTRQDITNKRWTEQDLRIKRAREEIIRCNMEIRRIHTAILDENDHFRQCISNLKEDDPLKEPVKKFIQRRTRTNNQVLARLHETFALDGFSGDKTRGTRLGMPTVSLPSDPSFSNLASLNQHVGGQVDMSGEQLDNLGELSTQDVVGLVDYISELPHHPITL